VTASKQTTDGADYTSSYVYNLGGALIEQTYPSGQEVRNVLDASGDLSLVQSKKNSASGYWNYASSFSYNAAGAVTSMQLGNGRWESTTFNSRMQPTQIALGSTPSATNLLDLDYSYGTTANNGNVMSQTITVPTVGSNTGFTTVQTYSYDSLNRLQDAIENITPAGGSQTQSWKQTFTFDRYGNRRFDESNTTMPASFSNQALTNPTISTSTNRLSSTGWAYDSSGNTTEDPNGRQFVYDAENKQVKVLDAQDATIGEYFYDGDGRRVKKIVPKADPEPDEVTIFVYGAGGQLIEEYSTIVETTNAKVGYVTNDHLGSPRINTDANGAVASRHDYHPFGEDISTSQRMSGLGYADDAVRKQFTGYERDNETILDFAEARMYNFNHGRFTAVDPLRESAKTDDPQSWNRYAYVLNKPLTLVDPTGKNPSTHIDENGKIITVIKDGDLGVYQHKKNADGGTPTEYMITKRHQKQGPAAGGTKIGETEFEDEFLIPDNGPYQGKVMTDTVIQVGATFDRIIQEKKDSTKGMTLDQIASQSGPGDPLDIKVNLANVGALLDGKYATSRSAGNFLAGYNARGAKLPYVGLEVTFDQFQKIAGAVQVLGRKPTMSEIPGILASPYGQAPTYGEYEYQRRMSFKGYHHVPRGQ
jgi:RHS repeat-associated protein